MRKRDVLKAAAALGCTIGETAKDGKTFGFEVKPPAGKVFIEMNEDKPFEQPVMMVEWGPAKTKEAAFAEVIERLGACKVEAPASKAKAKTAAAPKPAPEAKEIALHPRVKEQFTGAGDLLKWQITGQREAAGDIVIQAINADGKNRVVALVPFSTPRPTKVFGVTDAGDAKLVENAPSMFYALDLIDKLLTAGEVVEASKVAKEALNPLVKW